ATVLPGAPWSLEDLVADAIGHCPKSPAGQLQFEVADREILAVDSLDRCLTREIWSIDLRQGDIVAPGLVVVEHQGGAAPADLKISQHDTALRSVKKAELR
ncbi:MAG: hypothetical protein KC457_11435, partial [Myxococcales bacterium]|nr:hypothetical protein [Myxococcales bacterium]